MQSFSQGQVVWAPVLDGEFRVRVIEVSGDRLTVKLPGDDAGLATVPAARCFPSAGQPHNAEEAHRA